MGADAVVILGFVALIAGVSGAFGWPWAAIAGGILLLVGGAKLQQQKGAPK
jgi:hypothetical protein